MHNAVSVIANEIGKYEKPLTAAIDGRCAAGKTTLAEHFRELIGCNVSFTRTASFCVLSSAQQNA